jgi:hypothetical protein
MAKVETSTVEISVMSLLPSRSHCLASLVYFFIGIIGIMLMFNESSVLGIIINLISLFAWTWFLNYLCSIGYSKMSWILVLLPFILFLVMFLLALEFIKQPINDPSIAKLGTSYQTTIPCR